MAGRKIGEAFVQVRPTTDGFEQEAHGKLKAGLVGVMKAVGVAAAAAFAAALAVGISSVKAASDLNETVSKTQVIFGKAAGSVLAFSDAAATSFGISKQAALDSASSFALFAKSAGLTGKAVVGFSTQMTGLASDLASFFNTSPEDAIAAIGAALRGESEPIRRYNVLLDDATLRQAALRLGLIKTTKHALTPQQRILAAQAEILRQTSAAQGDFARTSGGLANQQRIAAASVANLKARIGTELLPVVTSVAVAFNSQLIPALNALWTKHGPAVGAALQKAADSAKSFFDGLQGGPLDSFSNSAKLLGGSLREFFVSIGSGDTTQLGESFKSAADSGKKLVPVVQQFLKDMPSLSDVVNVGATVLKFFADHADTLAKIMPVLVAAILAYKVAQLAANVAALLSVPTKIAEVVVNRQLIRSNRELIASRAALTVQTIVGTGATVANTGAESVGIVTRTRSIAVMVAQKIAMVATAVATGIWTAAQWLLNVALTANPIGIVIVAIAALIAVIVLIATKTNFFQDVWKNAWGAIRHAAEAVGSWFAGPFVNFFVGAWNLLRNLVTAGVGFYVARLTDLINFFRGLPGRVLGAVGDLGRLLWNAGRDIIQGLIDGVVSMFNRLKDTLGRITNLIPDWKGPHDRDLRLLFPAGRALIRGLGAGVLAELPAFRSVLGNVTAAVPGGALGWPLPGAVGGRNTVGLIRLHPDDIAELAYRIGGGVGRELNGAASGMVQTARAAR